MLEHHIRNYIAGKLSSLGINSDPYGLELTGIFVLVVIGVALIGYLITRHIIVRTISNVLQLTNIPLLEGFTKYKVFEKLTLLVPITILNLLFPLALGHYTVISTIADKILSISILVVFISMLFALLDALNDMATAKGITRRMPIKSFVQLIKLFAYFIGIVVSISILANESPVIFLSGLGVATGFVLLVFKDTILGFVAGIQLSANKMISLNDWIEMDAYKANGSVEEISLTTVKVRNFDNTVSMLPAYALVQNAFVNWQGMSDSGGRRIKRSVNIDVNSIRFMTDEEIESLKSIRILREYLFEKAKEINTFNEELDDIPQAGNIRQMTNVGIFRAYLAAYLRTNKDIHSYMMFMVRQLEPTPEGLPLQIYAFTNNTDWVFYEGVQADIFDHIYSIMPLFDLRPYQALSGHDAAMIGKSKG
ncbi:mechanosensitive ion channel family protein [Aliivibrio sp. S3MY1]|uniref:mechanosensitive ion channel family protein n=1 Tax=unclassified Aliivibrio TaxID=2645654 RepID=UPI002379888E|nr:MULTISPECIES: mechanosensitive ion channel family protein [unclassified Aliivibrio]MDD9194299.1 mechanosensitive ion channel family protein [Aliivibrio sp. S3MY1]MDD9197966.1 mechanosensitive ion channel family protein [Aliivibrio sp. S2MY1]